MKKNLNFVCGIHIKLCYNLLGILYKTDFVKLKILNNWYYQICIR